MYGSPAIPVTLQPLSNDNITSLQCQSEVYGDIGPCTMECKKISNVNSTTSLARFISNDFNDSNCTLVIQSSSTIYNGSYVIRIPKFNYLIYFSNFLTSDTQFVCNSNSSSTPEAPMMCRFSYRQQLFNNIPCPSTALTTRYIVPGKRLLCMLL